CLGRRDSRECPARRIRRPRPVRRGPSGCAPRRAGNPLEEEAASGAGSRETSGHAPGSRSTRAGSFYPNRFLRRFPLPEDRAPGGQRGYTGNSRYRSWSAHRAAAARSEPHWHDDVLGLRRRARTDETAAIGVGEAQLNLAHVDGSQRIEEIVYVEADLELLARIRDLQLFLSLLLLWIVRLQRQYARLHSEPDPTVFLVGENGRTLKRRTQDVAIRHDLFRRGGGNDAPRVREPVINQLRCEANITDLGANVIAADRQLHVAFVAKQALQLQ